MAKRYKEKPKKKWKQKMISIFIIIFLIGLCISIYNIIKWKIDAINIEKQMKTIQEAANIVEVPDTANTEIIEPEQEIEETNPYWDYIKMDLINVDFSELKSINSATVGWIQVNGTNINYPFVQAQDNKYYLTHSFDKSYNRAGWVFMDYRNNAVGVDKNTIIYAHGRLDNTMFGSLKNILSSGWLNNSNNFVIKISTETENTLWQVFSVYHIPTTSDYLRVSFNSDKDFKDFTQMLIDRSSYNFNTTVEESDRMLTLSTCYKQSDRVVLHAKLIKKELR